MFILCLSNLLGTFLYEKFTFISSNLSLYILGNVAVITINFPPILFIICKPFKIIAVISGSYACISSIITFEYANVEYILSYPLYLNTNGNI